MGKKVIYKQKEYPSIKALCEAKNKDYSLVIQRKNIGWTIEEAIDTPKKEHRNGCSVIYQNKTYPSLRNLALSKNMPYHVVQMRVKNGMDIKTAIETPVGNLMGNNTKFEGKEYSSFSKLCKAYNKPTSIVTSRINMGWSLEKALKTPIRKTKNHYVPKLEYKGKTYKSLKQLCDSVGADYQNTLNRLHRGKTLKEALETPKRERKIRG